jgi:hypothetical protein
MQSAAIKLCAKCNQVKPLADFPLNKKREDGHNKWCRRCSKKNTRQKLAYDKKDRKAASERQKRHHAKPGNREKQANYVLLWKFGITLETYNEMLAKQDRRCAICRTDKPFGDSKRFERFPVDHCHERNIIRGLLCNSCNNGLGRFKDDSKLLRAAADYLDRNK